MLYVIASTKFCGLCKAAFFAAENTLYFTGQPQPSI
jgi:hypothetical protein